MGENKRNYFQEYIDTVLSADGDSKNVLIIKHDHLLFPNEDKIDREKIAAKGYWLIYHRYTEKDIRKPYEPYLEVIKSYVTAKIKENPQYDVEAFLDGTGVYSLHKPVFKSYFQGKACLRDEDILLGEYEYEKKKITNAIINMLNYVSKEQKLLFVVIESNLGGKFQWEFVKNLLNQKNSDGRIKFVGAHDTAGPGLPYAESIMEAVVHLCENEDAACDWAYDIEGSEEKKQTATFDLDEEIRVISDSLMMLECDKAHYYLRNVLEYMDEKGLTFTQDQATAFYTLDYWANMLLGNNAEALLDCSRIENIKTDDEVRQTELKYIAECLKSIVKIYSDEKYAARKNLEKCEKLAKQLNVERYIFRVELLKNMAEYSGWRNLWISENDTEVDPRLLAWCQKYKCYNHLAHILVYSYNSDYKKFTKVEGLNDRIIEFNQGLEIAERLGNETFIDEAYRKNVMLASIHGYFDVCIYFYNKAVENVKRSGDETTEAGIYNGLGYSSCGLGRYEDAHKYYNNALKIFYKLRDVNNVIETLYNMGINAILAELYKDASEYLIEADNILNSLKQSSLTCCNISKLYGLIALACFRNGVVYQAYTYLNLAKAFLGNTLGKENEREMSSSDDSMFLVYFVDSLFEKTRGQYERALESLSHAEFYMKRSTGAMFFNYPQFVIEKYEVLNSLGALEEARKLIDDGIGYCKEKGFDFYEKKMKLAKEGKTLEGDFHISISGVSVKEIEQWIKHEAIVRNSEELLEIINLFWSLQKIIGQMKGDVSDELASIMVILKKKFCLDRVLFLDISKGTGHIEYSDLDIQVSDSLLYHIIGFFKTGRKGFTLSCKSSSDEEYENFANMFASVGILSFVAIPHYVGEELDAIMIAYIEITDDWLSKRRHAILDQRDYDILSYVMENICDAINRQKLTEGILDANSKLQIQMKDMEDLKNLAEEANRAKSRFLANMSHEIRTPINAIVGMNEMIMRESSNDVIRGYADDIHSATKSLLSIVNDILDMSKIESGKMEIIPTEYELVHVIHELSNMVLKRAKDKGLEFVLDVNPSLPSVLYGDDVRIKQVITNLLTNAVKYTEKGRVTLEIDGSVQGETLDLSVRVCDTGIGIKKEDLSKLFVAFERIEEERNRNIEGTGLGMNITFSLLKMMDSFLWVESEYGKGSVFSFHLKQKIVSDEAIGNIEEKMKHLTDDYDYKPSLFAPDAHILVVDDNEMNRKVFIGLLKGTKIKIDQAESGFRCLEMTQEKKYDLIFLDHMMPKMDGVETFQRIRGDETNLCNKVPIIILTANAIAGAREQYLEYGFDDYLSKPVVPAKLEKLIAKMLPRELLLSETEDKEAEKEDAEQSEDKEQIDLSQIPEMDLEYARLVLREDDLICQTAKDFYLSIDKEIDLLNEKIAGLDDETMLEEYRIQVHALKSSAKMIGMLGLSGLSRTCELAAKESNLERIRLLTPVLVEELLRTKENLSVFREEDSDKAVLEDVEYLKMMLQKVKSSAEDFDIDTLDALSEELRKYKYEDDIAGNVEALAEQIRNLQMEDVCETTEKILTILALTS
ncbi:MAG: response regulator [Roseburia sp.]